MNNSINLLNCCIILITITIKLAISENICTTEAASKSCAICLGIKDCVFCTDPEFENPDNANYQKFQTTRCNTRQEMADKCDKEFIWDANSTREIQKDTPTSTAANGQTPVHISPQLIKLSLRVGEPINVTMTYLDAEDKPLDLYYLMDLSATMEDDKVTVAEQGENLTSELKNITSNVYLGFGSFIDKPLMPFASYRQLYPDKNKGDKIPPYGFKNHLTLNNDRSKFTKTVNDTKISWNLDSPEGGLEAIMQALTCNETIGWRNSSRKILIMSTDGPFHIAGDGRLAGIVLPNDEKCHMNGNDYTHSTILDYPSIGQINSKVRETKVNLIFAITEDFKKLYDDLSKRIDSSKVVILKSNSANVVSEIKKKYKEIISTIELEEKVCSTSDRSINSCQGQSQGQVNQRTMNPKLKITYFFKCPSNDTEFTVTGGQKPKCSDLGVGKSVNFTIQLELEECPQSHKGQRTLVEICPFDLCPRERLTLDIDLACNCPCESKEQANAKYCKNDAGLKCGICACDKKYGGRNCACEKEKADDDKTPCIGNGTEICSGNGDCECQSCKCRTDEGPEGLRFEYSGTYCQYNSKNCLSASNKICSGKLYGKCEQGQCTCLNGRKGDKCQCIDDESLCTEPGTALNSTSKICNGHGDCLCKMPLTTMKCYCNSEGYIGQFCHKKIGETGKRCDNPSLHDCVQCQLNVHRELNGTDFSARKLASQNCDVKCNHYLNTTTVGLQFNWTFVDELTAESKEEETCNFKDEKECTISFKYSYVQKYLQIELLTQLRCPPKKEFPLTLVGTVSGSILFTGILALLIWRLCTYLQDTREFKKFEQQRRDAKWDKGTNPLYSAPTSEFQNPAYKG